MLSGRGLCDGLITRPEDSYGLCCVVVCDLETSRMGAPYIYDISHLRVKLTKFYEVPTRLKLQTSVFLYKPYGRFSSRSTWIGFRPKHKSRHAVPKVCSKDRLGSVTSSHGIRGNISQIAIFKFTFF